MLQLPIVNTNTTQNKLHPALNWKLGHKLAGETIYEPYTLSEAIKRLAPLPKRTGLIGQSAEGIPVLFNLTDPRPGSLLILSDHHSGKTRLLKTLAHTLARQNKAEEVRFGVISARPKEWDEEHSRYGTHFMQITSNIASDAVDLIYQLGDLVEDRQKSGRVGTGYVLLFDGIDTLPHMDLDLRANFEWLVQFGARHQIWTVATIDPASMLEQRHYADLFRTRITGAVTDAAIASRLLSPPSQKLAADSYDRHFTVRVKQNWLKFYLPESLG